MTTLTSIGAKKPPLRPIAVKVLSRLQKASNTKVVDLAAVRAGRAAAATLMETVATEKDLAAYHPAHAVYVFVLNQVSVLFEILSEMDELSRITNLVVSAEDLYMPGWPPMSPISQSHFNTWSFFDAAVGIKRETIGTVLLDIAGHLQFDDEFSQILNNLQNSRLGLYVHEGGEREHIVLREIYTGSRKRVLASNAHWGRRGEIWLTRLVSPPHPDSDEYVALISPYIIEKTTEGEWLTFFQRNLPKVVGARDVNQAFELLMKYGFGPRYWNEYIFEGYWMHDGQTIGLAGLPDVPMSLPQSKKFNPNFRFPINA